MIEQNAVVPKLGLAWRMRVVFAGSLPPKEYVTPDVRNTDPGWGSELFKRPMESLEFHLPTGHRIILSGMEQYNFFVEAVRSMKIKGGAKIVAFWLCGKHPVSDVVDVWRIGNGKVIRDQKPFGREWGGGPTRGWKPGIVGGDCFSGVV